MGLFSKKEDFFVTRSGTKLDREDLCRMGSYCGQVFNTSNLDDVFEIFAPLLMQKFDMLDKIDLIIKQNEDLKQRCMALETKISNLENNRSR